MLREKVRMRAREKQLWRDPSHPLGRSLTDGNSENDPERLMCSCSLLRSQSSQECRGRAGWGRDVR